MLDEHRQFKLCSGKAIWMVNKVPKFVSKLGGSRSEDRLVNYTINDMLSSAAAGRGQEAKFEH